MSANNIDLFSEIIVAPYNEMEVDCNLFPFIKENLPSSINVHNTKQLRSKLVIRREGETEIACSVRVLDRNDLPAGISVHNTSEVRGSVTVKRHDLTTISSKLKLRFKDEIRSNLTVSVGVELPGRIDITFSNQMWVVYDALPIPKITDIYYPVMDAFIRSQVPRLNYGVEADMFVGSLFSFNEIYRSLVSFGISGITLPEGHEITHVRLRLHQYTSTDTTPQTVQILKITEPWTENGVTWNNQPLSEDVVASEIIEITEGKSYFDLTEYVKTNFFSSSETINEDFGFLIKAVDETNGTCKRFGTKESDYSPVLEIEHFNPVVYSAERVNLPGSVRVAQPAESDLRGTVEVKSFYGHTSLPCILKLSYQIECSLKVSRDNLKSTVTVAQSAYDSLPSAVTTRLKIFKDLEIHLAVSKLEIPGRLVIAESDDLPSSVSIRVSSDYDLKSRFSISRLNMPGSILIRERSNLPSTVSVLRYGEYTVPAKLIVSRLNMPGSILIRERSNLPSTVSVLRYGDHVVPAHLVVTRKEILGHVTTRLFDDLVSRVKAAIRGESDLQGNVTVKQHKESGIHCRVVTKLFNDLNGSVLCVSGYLASKMVVKKPEDRDLSSQVRVRQASEYNIPCNVVTRLSSNLISTVSVRQFGENEIPSLVIPKYKSDLSSQVKAVSGWLKSKIKVVIPAEDDLPGSFVIFVYDDLPCVITPRYHVDMRGSMVVRVHWANDLPTKVTTIFSSYMHSTLEVKSRSDLQSNFYVRDRLDIHSKVEIPDRGIIVFIM